MGSISLSVVQENRCYVCPTRSVCLATDANNSQLAQLPDHFRCVETLSRGKYLYRAGDTAVAHYHVRAGMLKTYVIDAEGGQYVTGFYLPGEVLGNIQVAGVFAETAIALETSSVCELDENGMVGCAEMGLVVPLLRQLANNAGIQAQQQINLRQSSAQHRFAGFCVMYAQRLRHLGRDCTHLPTPMSRTDIASYLGMTLESLSRVISKLHSAKVISASRYAIDILQPDTLNALGEHVRF
jgi:CRP/FNR family transcriptional regulator